MPFRYLNLALMPPRFHDVRAAQREVELKNPTLGVGPDNQDFVGTPIAMDLPGIYLTGVGRVCSYRVGISPVGLYTGPSCTRSPRSSSMRTVSTA